MVSKSRHILEVLTGLALGCVVMEPAKVLFLALGLRRILKEHPQWFDGDWAVSQIEEALKEAISDLG